MASSREDLDPIFDAKRIKQLDEYERDAGSYVSQPQKKENNSIGNLGIFSEKRRERIESYLNALPASSADSTSASQAKGSLK